MQVTGEVDEEVDGLKDWDKNKEDRKEETSDAEVTPKKPIILLSTRM